ncbi:MAG: rane dipeptidase [Thermosediminibacterales bacterium]|nr:rane dipeptidase [Thermosediminibacterales bacterium]MDK2835234.1 rane dipeptidase [Thermosediminibacterales bacterium]
MFKLSKQQEERAYELHKKSLVFDAHCDTVLDVYYKNRKIGKRSEEGHVDLPRLKKGGINAQIFALFIKPQFKPYGALRETLRLYNTLYNEVENNRDVIEFAYSVEDIKQNFRESKISAVVSVEGGEALEGDIDVLSVLYRLGIRCITLTWNQRNQIGDGVDETRTGGGLTEFGIEVVKEMNRLGMMIDVSHLSEAGFWDVIETSNKPIIASHSNARKLCDHPRNLYDEQIKALADNGGVIGVSFATPCLQKEKNLEDFLDHIDYISQLVGIDHIGLGMDFDGIDYCPRGVGSVEKAPNITRGLVYRGYTDEQVQKILGLNFLRVFNEIVG